MKPDVIVSLYSVRIAAAVVVVVVVVTVIVVVVLDEDVLVHLAVPFRTQSDSACIQGGFFQSQAHTNGVLKGRI